MSKNILFLTPYNLFPPFWGGGNRTYNMVKHLSTENEVHLISPSYRQFEGEDGTEYRARLKEEGVDIELVGPPTSWIQYINPFLLAKALWKIRKHDIDLVICDYPWSGIYALTLYKLTQTPYFVTEHNVEHEVAKQTGYENPVLTKMLEKKVCEKAEEVFCVSDKDRRKLISSLGLQKEKIHVIKNGFNANRFYPGNGNGKRVREKLGIDEDNPVVFFCGKMDYIPNNEAVGFIYHEIMPRVLEEVPDAKFLAVGGGYDIE
ncbi:MAG: glycosyltransferase family 4 protein, partial [Candidatus Aenigmatarchaeota archaeon]